MAFTLVLKNIFEYFFWFFLQRNDRGFRIVVFLDKDSFRTILKSLIYHTHRETDTHCCLCFCWNSHTCLADSYVIVILTGIKLWCRNTNDFPPLVAVFVHWDSTFYTLLMASTHTLGCGICQNFLPQSSAAARWLHLLLWYSHFCFFFLWCFQWLCPFIVFIIYMYIY